MAPTPAERALRILIVDDHPVFRDGLRAALASTEGMSIIGEVATGSEAIAAAGELHPDVIVMDINMPGINGIEATRQIVAMQPDAAILVLSMSDDDQSVVSALRAGARGYVLKDSARLEIARAVEAVAAGQVVLALSVGQRVIDHALGANNPAETAFPTLTERECEVLELIAQGHNNQAIARRLSLSSKTVRNHVSNIFTKLEVPDRGSAIVRAREAGLGVTPGRT